MRFSAPRSLSPSPERKTPRRPYAFGLPADEESDSSSDLDSGSDSDDYSSSSDDSDDDSLFHVSTVGSARPTFKPRPAQRSPAQQRDIEDTVAAIRLRTRHHDPYEEWEKQTRKEAYRTARKELESNQSQLHDEQERVREIEAQRQAALHEQQMAEVQSFFSAFKLKQQGEEERLAQNLKIRNDRLWQRIEHVIKLDEEKAAKKVEEERKRKEEEERTRKEEELKQRLAIEKRLQEEEQKKKAEEEEAQKKEEEEKKKAEEKQRTIDEENTKKQQLEMEQEQRKSLGVTTADEEWREARFNLHVLKSGAMKLVKSNPQLKKEWSKWRRQITPKIGQLTNDADAINKISTELLHILQPPSGAHNQDVYTALLSSLAKAIIQQAETEVTAEKRSAIPLAHVAFNLLSTLQFFPEVFFAKLVQRVGGWPIPCVVPHSGDYDGTPWPDTRTRTKAMGYRKSESGTAGPDDIETPAEYALRVAGVMRVYFHVLKLPPLQQPERPMFQMPRYWTWFARMVGEKRMLEAAVAPQLIYTALDVMGSQAKDIWGVQWIKMLELIYEGVTAGLGNGKFVGGESPEGAAARVRVQLEVERIMSGIHN